MGFLKDFWSGSIPSQNSGQSRDLPPRQPSPKPAAVPPPLPQNDSRSETSAAERARRKFKEGLRLIGEKRGMQCMEAFIEATEIDPDCVDAWFALGRAFHTIDADKHVDRIMECAQNALRAEPNNPKSKSLGVVAFSKKGELEAASDDWPAAYYYFKRAYDLEPDGRVLSDDNSGDSVPLLDTLAWSAERADKFPDFVVDLRARVLGMPNDRRAKYILGRTLTKMSIEAPLGSQERNDMLSEAEAQLTEFLLGEPLGAEANYFLGYVYVGQGRTRLAAEIVAKLADIDIKRSRELQEVLD